ncbi:response regulator receiver domain-containing protein [Ancylobacter aquaticus]|uniref:Response regulator receiver domain-containing protein n=2 Tax=Ancylobacter aquaticus TaxID=100 RepID=A0A4R1HZ40_ANCAQ|nr:response regulator receiver domain-containing protein [Ancylobacter aquaticus]
MKCALAPGVLSMPIAVLVVEDEALVRFDIADYLAEQGFEVHEAASADQALKILEAIPEIRLLFTDIDMPGSMDGLKLSAAVRKRWPPVQIIVTSGNRIAATAELPPGSLFFSKPYTPADIARSMQGLLASGST